MCIYSRVPYSFDAFALFRQLLVLMFGHFTRALPEKYKTPKYNHSSIWWASTHKWCTMQQVHHATRNYRILISNQVYRLSLPTPLIRICLNVNSPPFSKNKKEILDPWRHFVCVCNQLLLEDTGRYCELIATRRDQKIRAVTK